MQTNNLKKIFSNLFNKNTNILCESESDFYGASFLINRLLKNSLPRPLITKTLKHGWIPNRMVSHPKQIIHWGDENDLHLCFNNKQKQFLKSKSYKNVHAIGAPFLYAYKLLEDEEISRESSSVLIMPAHTLKHVGGNTFYQNFFIDSINEASKVFARKIKVCIHQESECKESDHFFKIRNIEVIKGARYDDSLTLLSQVKLFRRAEYLLTNSIGSHVLYALYCGCKVKIIDMERPKLEDLLKHEWYKSNKEVAVANVDATNKLFDLYPEFRGEWFSNQTLKSLIDEEIGENEFKAILFDKTLFNFLSTNNLKVLKWNLKNYFPYLNFSEEISNKL